MCVCGVTVAVVVAVYGVICDILLTNRFFEHVTIWPPTQLDREMRDLSMWYSLRAPVRVLFDDNPAALVDNDDEDDAEPRDKDGVAAQRAVPSLFERLWWSLPQYADEKNTK